MTTLAQNDGEPAVYAGMTARFILDNPAQGRRLVDGDELFRNATGSDDPAALCVAADALLSFGASLDPANALRNAHRAEVLATRAGSLHYAAAAAQQGARAAARLAEVSSSTLRGIPIEAPLTSLGEPPAARPRSVVIDLAPLAVASTDAPLEDRVWARACGVHAAHALARAGAVARVLVVAAGRAGLWSPLRAWDLPLLLSLAPPVAPGDERMLLGAGSLRRIGGAIVVDVTLHDRRTGEVLAPITTSPSSDPGVTAADLARRLVHVVARPRTRRFVPEPVPHDVLRAEAALLGPLLAASGFVDRAPGAGAALLGALPLLERDDDGDVARLVLSLAACAAALGYASPATALALLEDAISRSGLTATTQERLRSALRRRSSPTPPA